MAICSPIEQCPSTICRCTWIREVVMAFGVRRFRPRGEASVNNFRIALGPMLMDAWIRISIPSDALFRLMASLARHGSGFYSSSMLHVVMACVRGEMLRLVVRPSCGAGQIAGSHVEIEIDRGREPSERVLDALGRTLAELRRHFVCQLAHVLLAPPLACGLDGVLGTEHLEERLERVAERRREVE